MENYPIKKLIGSFRIEIGMFMFSPILVVMRATPMFPISIWNIKRTWFIEQKTTFPYRWVDIIQYLLSIAYNLSFWIFCKLFVICITDYILDMNDSDQGFIAKPIIVNSTNYSY